MDFAIELRIANRVEHCLEPRTLFPAERNQVVARQQWRRVKHFRRYFPQNALTEFNVIQRPVACNCFGTMQCLWKHRDLTFNARFGALGLFSLPSIWFFQILFVALVPLVDAVLVFSIFTGSAMTIWHYFAIFLGLDLLLAALACWMDEEPLVRALIILPMRFVYRWLLAWVVWKSIVRVMKGAFVGWGKLERTATVGTTP